MSKRLFVPLLVIPLLIGMTENQAFAGGDYDPVDPYDSDQYNQGESRTKRQSLNPQNHTELQSIPIPNPLNWNKWSVPYIKNNQICRENSGNVACFNPDVAQKLRWKIPSQN